MTRSIVWFKRDLRVSDHAPLARAVSRGDVLGLYVHEPIVIGAPETSAGHLRFIEDCLEELQARFRELGSELVVRHGRITNALDLIHGDWRFDELWSHEETGLAATYHRDIEVRSWCRSHDVRWTEMPQHGVFRPLPSRNGWATRWRRRMAERPLDAPRRMTGPDSSSLERLRASTPTSPPPGIAEDSMIDIQSGGEAEGGRILDSFLHERGEHYRSAMSTPIEGWTACSRISAHLAYGSLSVRTAFHAARDRAEWLRLESESNAWGRSIASFEKRLRWHCHFIQKLEDEPEIEHRNFNRAYDGLRQEDRNAWTESERNRFEAYVGARTGYPLVDACLRCLGRTGWINFRMRAMLMSFAAYHLWLHWKPIAEHLATRFLDFEPGIHYAQCQMQSGTTGINTVRIYSPIKQAADQDPRGVFIRRWIPELEHVPDEFIAQPHTMPELTQLMANCRMGVEYPLPIVEHATAYREAKRRIFNVRGSSRARTEATRVYERHGSRRRPTEHR